MVGVVRGDAAVRRHPDLPGIRSPGPRGSHTRLLSQHRPRETEVMHRTQTTRKWNVFEVWSY